MKALDTLRIRCRSIATLLVASFIFFAHGAVAEDKEANETEASREKLVRALQIGLKGRDCYSGKVDGKWGPRSQRALEAFGDATGNTSELDAPTEAALEIVEASNGDVCTSTAQKPKQATTPPKLKKKTKVRQAKKRPRGKKNPKKTCAGFDSVTHAHKQWMCH